MTSCPSISIGQSTDIGPKDRNDDSFGVLVPEAGMITVKGIAMAIADGMSTSEGGKEASETCVKSFLMDYYDTPESWTVKTAVSRVLSATNRWLHSQGEMQYLHDKGMVSTFSGLIFKAGTAHIFHVGDSRISRLRDGTIEPLTRDHRVHVGAKQDYLARAMGVDLNVDIDYRQVAVEQNDLFLFTTDGVHDHVSTPDFIRIISAHTDQLDEAAGRLTQLALERGALDNVTCQLVRFDEVGSLDETARLDQLTALPIPPDLTAGMVIDGYRVVRELTSSSRSQVYLVEDIDSRTALVMKTPSVNFEDDPTYLDFFLREEWVGQQVTSPHVAHSIMPKTRRTFLYTLMEHVDGQTLRQWMTDNPEPGLQQVRTIIEQIAAGLRALHRKEMIHQDLKPENVMIDHTGTVKLIDFGAVRVFGLEETAPETVPDYAQGSLNYTAPELFSDALATRSSDLYALATLAYETLSGDLPFGNRSRRQRSAGKGSYRSLAPRLEAVPVWVDSALQKALSENPAQRHAALSEFCTDLTRPNPAFARDTVPFMERNPLAFWKGLSFVLAILLTISLII